MNKSLNLKKNLTLLLILALTAVCLLVRLEPYRYILAGQDQGTYLSIGHQYATQRTLNYNDYFRESLTLEQKEMYDNYIYNLMPSIVLTNLQNSVFEMSFYPMHPLWLAIFEILFGQENAIYSITFFSFISILALSLLAYEISGKKKLPAYLTTLVLTINPMHAFFSKFPVGEITAVAFTSLGFYFLVRYLNRIITNNERNRDLILSLLFFTCFFYTRMSSLIYVPLFLVFAGLAVLYLPDIKARKYILIYFGLLISSFCLSYIFYYSAQPALFHLIYRSTVQKIISRNSDTVFAVFFIFAGIIISSLYKIKNEKVITKIKQVFEMMLPTTLYVMLAAVFYFSLVRSLDINLRIFYPTLPFERYWYRGDDFFQIIKYLNIFVIMQYLTPIGFVLSCISGFHYIKDLKKNVFKVALFAFTMWFLLINVKFGGLVNYHYYFTRYLFSESVVYMLVLICVFIGDLIQNQKTKILGVILFISIICCSLPFTLFQLNGPEGPHMDFYNNLTSQITQKDLILTATGHSTEKPQKYFDNFTTWSIAPLKFYYDLNVFILPQLSDAYTRPIKQLAQKYSKTYLISDKEILNFGANLITTRHRYSYYNVSEECSLHTYSFLPLESVVTMKIPKFLECLTPPNNYYTRYSNIYMYDVTEKLKTKT